MPAYRLLTTRHHPDGSIETPSAFELAASDDRDADAKARRYPISHFVEGVDYAWLVDRQGAVVCSFTVVGGRLA